MVGLLSRCRHPATLIGLLLCPHPRANDGHANPVEKRLSSSNVWQRDLVSKSQKSKEACWRKPTGLLFKPGSVLLSHSLTAAVSSALEGLTSVFEMGTGVTPPAWPPGNSMKTLNADGRTQDLFRSFFQKSSLSCHKNGQESFALVFGEKDLTCRPFGAATQ